MRRAAGITILLKKKPNQQDTVTLEDHTQEVTGNAKNSLRRNVHQQQGGEQPTGLNATTRKQHGQPL